MADVEERGFRQALDENPGDTASRLAYADWLEEHGRRHEAIHQRAAADVSWVVYKIRRKSDGLYSNGRGGWSAKGAEWTKVSVLKAHLTYWTSAGKYAKTEWGDLEVAVFEIPLRPAVLLTLSGQRGAVVLEEARRSGAS